MADEPVKTLEVVQATTTPAMSDREYAALLEQYKLYVESAREVSARREATNNFFLALHTLIAASIGVIMGLPEGTQNPWTSAAIASGGIALSFIWWRLIISHKGLNTGKFAVIQAIERRLPIQPYADEWKAVGEGKDRKKYWPFTHLETKVPWIFATLHVAIVVVHILQPA